MYPFSTFTNPGEPQEELEGVDAYSIIPNKDARKAVLTKTVIPISPYSSNLYSNKFDVTLNPNIDGSISISRNATVTGLAKQSYYPEGFIG